MPGVTKITNMSNIRAREVDFVTRFGTNWDQLREIMGIMRPIRKTPGTQLVSYKASMADSTLATSPAEGTVIATPVENIDHYYVDPSDSQFAKLSLEYTVEGETNLIGFHTEGNYRNGYSYTKSSARWQDQFGSELAQWRCR